MYKGLLLQIVKDQLLLCYSFNSIAPGAIAVNYYFGLFDQNVGRSSRIRTCGPLHPMQVRYRAAPYSELVDRGRVELPMLPCHGRVIPFN